MNQLKWRSVAILFLLFFMTSCEEQDDYNTSDSTQEQTIVGTWSGVTDQGLPFQMVVDEWKDTMAFTSYDFVFTVDGDTLYLGSNDPENDTYISADTFNFDLIRYNQKEGSTKGTFWNSNYMTGLLEANMAGDFHYFDYAGSKVGYPTTIHSSPMYSLVFEDTELATYTYVKSYFATHDTLNREGRVVLSSLIFYDPSTNGQNNLFEVRLGSIPEDYSADDISQLMITGFKSYSIDAEDGVEIIYWDKGNNYKTWSTSFGSASQESSQFNISEVHQLTGSDSTDHIYKFIANFNCILYDAEGNEKKVIKAMHLGLFGAGLDNN